MADLTSADWLKFLGTNMQAQGMITQGQSYLQHGQMTNASAQFAAEQLRRNALDTEAASQRTAFDVDRQTKYTMSRALAMAAGGGGGASDPTIINLLSKISGEGAYKQAVALYGGASRGQAMRNQAAAQEVSGADALMIGKSAAASANMAAASTLFKGGVSLYSKYGQGGPKTNSSMVGDFSDMNDA